ncbi:YcjF family protein [Aerococcus sp. NPDC058936]|uniref:YcjF family protein n=1 Tax=Aerococcus sp. NPDC058936 TaxID=3346674 RepID=UPI00366CE000
MAKNMDWSLAGELTKKTQEEIEKIEKVHILVVGKTGVGKSTLINSIFREKLAETGIGQPITKHLHKIEKEGVPMVLYDTRGLELDTETQMQVTGEIDDTLTRMVQNKEHMHVAYYCINASSSRIENMEIRLIEYLASKMPVILVLTQSVGEQALKFEQYLVNQNLPVQAIIRLMAKDYKITDELIVPAFGLKELVERTFGLLPHQVHTAFNNAQQIDIERKGRAARRWARRYIVTTFGVGFTPIPFSDATVLVPMQIGMMAHITAIFGISMDQTTTLGILGAIGGTGSATYLGRLIVSNLVKFIPGIGSVAGGMISGTTASIITTALAMSYIEVLTFIATAEANGEEVSPRTVRKLMKDLYGQRLQRGQNDPDFQAAMADIETKKGQDAERNKAKDISQGMSLDDKVKENGQKARINWPKWSFRNRKR